MTKASDNAFPSLLITEGTVPSSPAAGKQRLYIDSTTHAVKVVNSGGTASNVGGGGTTVATDTIWAAQGDIVVATGNDAAAVLTKGATGTVPTAGASTLAYAYPPGYQLDYVEFTSQVTITATSEGASAAVVTGTSQAYAAGDYWVEFYCPFVQSGNFTTFTICLLYDGGTVLGRLGRVDVISGDGAPMTVRRRLTLTGATHQLIVKAYIDAGTQANYIAGTGGSAAYLPGYILVTKA